ncbi:(S)-2-haloacid dehalogenase 4A [Lachnellula hyalina]|uniref:(S)-2-haloacid dehalogenase 4A n=1 Tax=Lachnellula hyalina TaxID=1316788 RepID=A0A8H8R8M8_9HELO|nr:(S)-2-haloacid dehalogenase 4A [Lachnellula hyalina]TVY29596.1 (S)-2-haloacid dehalogenase 4A [Lachnellula hyalina]
MPDLLQTPPKALSFDVFGTVEVVSWGKLLKVHASYGSMKKLSVPQAVPQFDKAFIDLLVLVDWRKTVTSTLVHSAANKISSSSRSANLSPEVRTRLSTLTDKDWAQFAQEWRNSYKKFTKGFVPGETEWLDIDTHHHLALIDLLKSWQLEGMYTEDEVEELSLIWHYLDPWTDSSAGLHKLGSKFITSTLSNGNQSLLKDLNQHGNLGFRMLQSSGDFKAYKPHPSVYLGAAKAMGVQPVNVAMVAAHLDDLKAARRLGFKTIYVERKQEEDWTSDQEEYKDAKTWVDMWVTEEEDGFIEVARRFGIE